MSESSGKRPGPGRPSLSGSAKKRSKLEAKTRYESHKTRITAWVSAAVAERFEKMKSDMNITTNGIAVKFLLDTYEDKSAVEAEESLSEDEPKAPFAIPMPMFKKARHKRGEAHSSLVEGTSSESEEASFDIPVTSRSQSSRMAISTPAKAGISGDPSIITDPSTGLVVATGTRVTSSISGSSTEEMSGTSAVEEVADGSGLSDIERLEASTSKADDTIRSGTWEVELHEELLPPGDEDDTGFLSVGEHDESYFPSDIASSDSMNLSYHYDIIQELIENAGFNLSPAEDEDVITEEKEDELLELDFDELELEDEEEEDQGEAVQAQKSGYIRVDDFKQHKDEMTAISFASCLKQLATLDVPKSCRLCGGPLHLEESQVGTALYLKWVCNEEKHTKNVELAWCSQPRFKHGATLGDFMGACAVLFSGNDYGKIVPFLNAINMKAMNRTLFQQVCGHYANAAIEELWEETHKRIIEEHSGDVIMLGDGRMDSPGFSAEYCTYTAMDSETKDIIDMVIVNKRETNLNSVTMEREGCRRALDNLNQKGVKVCELATDAHTQISSMMAKEYEDIFHSYDVWHGAKNLGKRLAKVAMEAKCRPLLPWVRDIVNHFWHVVKHADTYEDFVEKWRGIQHHIVNKHSWLAHPTDANLTGYMECDHTYLEAPRAGKEWLTAGSPAHEKLIEIIMDHRFLKTVPKFLRFRNTSMIECFNSKILIYAPKRISFRPPSYKARCRLAALDYQSNKDRAVAKTKEGKPMLQLKYRKGSKRWDAVEVKEKKSYHFIGELMEVAVEKRLAHPELLRKKLVLEESDPRKIMPRLTHDVPESAEAIFEKKVSRM